MSRTATATRHRVEVGAHRRTLDPNPWPTPGAFLDAVRLACIGGPIDPALRPVAAGSDEQGAYSDPHGGFFVPQSYHAVVQSVSATEDPSFGRMTIVPMTTADVAVNARVDKAHAASVASALVIYRTPETVEIAASRMQFEQIKLSAGEMNGLTFATTALVHDSFPSFTAVLEAAFFDAFSERQLEERVRGSGTAEYAGVLHSSACITIVKESGQSAGSVLASNFLKMRARCWGYSRATWLVHPELYPQVITASAPIGKGGSIVQVWQPGDDDGSPDRILGRPAFFSTAASARGDRGDVMLVDWSQYLHGVYRPMEGVMSIHVRFFAFENAFRFTLRDDGKPWWHAPVLPPSCTESLSPFVTLEARA